MVEWLGLPKKAHQIEAVVQRALAKGARTPDLGERQDGGCDKGRERILGALEGLSVLLFYICLTKTACNSKRNIMSVFT